jgi:hypothetical protein
LARESERVAHLRERRGLLGNGANDFSAADRLKRKKLGVPHVIHQPQPQFVDDGLDLGGRRDQNVMLCLDEEKKRDDEKRCWPETDLTAVSGLRVGIDRG